MSHRSLLIAALLSATAGLAQAGDVGQHPAVFSPRQPIGVDASTFIVGHPASPQWVAGHANFEHPAVTASRAAEVSHPVDANTFLVQPPASTHWEASAAVAAPDTAVR